MIFQCFLFFFFGYKLQTSLFLFRRQLATVLLYCVEDNYLGVYIVSSSIGASLRFWEQWREWLAIT